MSSVNLDSLTWIKSELERSLEASRQRLDAFAEEPQKTGLLAEVVDHLHQVSGTLTMVEVRGGQMLAEHLEALTRAIKEGRLSTERTHLEPLMRGCLELSDYLDRMVSGMRDSPAVLLPVTNEIRTLLGREPLARQRRKPPAMPRPKGAAPGESISVLAARLRPRYQASLLAFYQGNGGAEPVVQMRGVIAELEMAASHPPVFEFLWVAGGVLEALDEGGLEPTLGVKRLLGQVERELKRLATSSEAALAEEPPESLVDELLAEIQHASTAGERVAAIRTNFQLGQGEGEAEQSVGAGLGSALLRSVSTAILEDLGRVHDRIDIFVRTGRKQPSELTPVATTLKKAADALGLMGLTESSLRVKKQSDAVASMASSGGIEESALLHLATELIGIEGEVEAFLHGAGMDPQAAAQRSARLATLREVLAEISRMKNVIGEHMRNSSEAVPLRELPRLADNLARTLDFMNLPEVAPLVHRMARYLDRLADNERLPERIELDRLADAVVSIEYYVEALQRERGVPTSMLDNAARALSVLGIDDSQGAVVERELPAAEQPSEALDSDTDLALAAETGWEAPDFSLESAEPSGDDNEQSASEVSAAADESAHEPQTHPHDALGESGSGKPALAPAVDLPPVAEEGADPEIVEIFIEEAQEVFAELNEYYPRWRERMDDEEALITIRRAFHTLKGSGRMVGAKRLGEFAWACENLLNRVIDHTLPASEALAESVGRAIAAADQLLNQFRDGTEPSEDIARLMALLNAMARDEGLDTAPMPESSPEPKQSGEDREERNQAPVESEAVDEGDEAAIELPADFELDQGGDIELVAPATDEEAEFFAQAPEDTDQAPLEGAGEAGEPVPRIDPVLYEIYFNETQSHLATLKQWLDEVASDGHYPVTFDLERAVHTLLGSARMAQVEEVAATLKPLDSLVKLAQAENWPGSSLSTEIEAAAAITRQLVAAYGDSTEELPLWEPLRDQLKAELAEREPGEDERAQAGDETAPSEALSPGNSGESPASEEIEGEAGEVPGTTEVPEEPESGASQDEGDRLSAESDLEVRRALAEEGALSGETPEPEPAAVQPERPVVRPARTVTVIELEMLEGYDPSLAEVFLAEANELLEGADGSVHAWSQDHDQTESLTDLLRRLHTLKGGARMVGLSPLADMSHELESLLVRVADGRVAVSGDLLRLVERAFDRLHRMLEHAAGDGRVPYDTAVIIELQRYAGTTSLYEEDEEADEALSEADTEMAEATSGESGSESEDMHSVESEGAETAEAEQADEDEDGERRVAPRLRHEMARVRADLLESSINNAGELSIYRSRVEQQLVNMNMNLVELDRTVERVHTQLRELDIETEAQILSEHRTQTSTEGFDPLEFDRYTRLHELSRSLAEAVSDLSSLRSLLASELQQANVLLERQGRVNGDLQDALMRTRMVPFSLSASRLRRIVRNTAEEAGKQAELKLQGVEGEMDRQVLEHILPALEHLLRNAVVHGIEDAKIRASRGKPAIGQIELRLRREGADMMIEVLDDGGGLDLKAIRAKAEQEQIIQPGAELSERELIELVFRPGFSTASELTQSAGRGVGMDVVAAEARQVGGSVEVESKPFEGACWRLRLPVTLAITQALLIRIGHTLYPVPLASLNGIQRVQRDELSELMATEAPSYEYGGNAYRLLSLSKLLGEQALSVEEEAPRVPLLLVDVGDRHLALVADDMEGNREVVVKPVGPQVAHVPGISGATIFGDGSIGLLLDLAALVRSLPQLESLEAAAPVEESASTLGNVAPLVMVVDDSITVRRVTQRLLERRGARVLTAKDGVEALEQLQDNIPDVMLLDIEMPRMDGYELAGHMKNDSRLRSIPIIVITSRTGEKHRARADQIGIDRYLGKPYQEIELLEAIQSLIVGFDPLGTRTMSAGIADDSDTED